MEGDAQVCINAINGPTANIPLKILPVISNVKVLASAFNFCSFVWVRRSANSVVPETELHRDQGGPLPLPTLSTKSASR